MRIVRRWEFQWMRERLSIWCRKRVPFRHQDFDWIRLCIEKVKKLKFLMTIISITNSIRIIDLIKIGFERVTLVFIYFLQTCNINCKEYMEHWYFQSFCVKLGLWPRKDEIQGLQIKYLIRFKEAYKMRVAKIK